MTDRDLTEALCERVQRAAAAGERLHVRGAGTHAHLAPRLADTVTLALHEHRGILEYRPSELVFSARAGTPLGEVRAALRAQGQQLSFDPVQATPDSTLGGLVATGLAGPRRPWGGAVRDAILGTRVLDGRGEVGRYGGQVIKNVAGYDVSRLMTGAWGTLGVLLDVSLRVCAVPAVEATRCFDLALEPALGRMLELARQPLPLTGLAWHDGELHVRLSGSTAGVGAALARLGGSEPADAEGFWRRLGQLSLPGIADDGPLWRLSVPAAAPQPRLPGNWLISWGGAERWCVTDAPPERVHGVARDLGGHAMRWRPDVHRGTPDAAVQKVQRALKQVFDPHDIINPGVLIPPSAQADTGSRYADTTSSGCAGHRRRP